MQAKFKDCLLHAAACSRHVHLSLTAAEEGQRRRKLPMAVHLSGAAAAQSRERVKPGAAPVLRSQLASA